MTKILITGGNGFVGKALISVLLKDTNAEIISLVRSYQVQPQVVEQLIAKNIFQVDFPENIDVIIHLAGRAHILNEQASDALTEFRKVNVEGTLQLARQTLDKKVKRFIFLSSIGVNGSVTSHQPFKEDTLTKPHADYAVSKLEAEQELKKLFTGSETELVIIRPPLVYAAHAPGNFARLLKLVSTNLPLPFLSTKNNRSFVALENLVDFIQVCIEHPNAANQTFLVADNESISTRELVEYLKEGMDKKPYFIYIPQPLMKLGAACIGKSKLYEQLFESLEIDTSKIQDVLSWKAPFSAKEALIRVGQNYQNLEID